MAKQWIVIEGQAWCNDRGAGVDYGWDGMRFASREAAVAHGFTKNRSDDFNVASLEGNTLLEYYWMDRPMRDPGGLAEIAEQNGFDLKAT